LNPTGFITPLADELDSEHPLLWFNDFNTKMISASLKLRLQFDTEETYLSRVNTLINDRREIHQFKAKKNAGWRGRRQDIREIMDGKV